jgi:hypothetical protein
VLNLFWLCVVSAIIEPIIKPKAGENPTFEAKITIIKQSQ